MGVERVARGNPVIARYSKIRAAALKHGWRSGLEESVAADLDARDVRYEYEQLVIKYTPPAKTRRYTPDFVLLDNGIIVETKGRFLTADRQKHLAIKSEHPRLDIRFVFSNPNARISKTSKTTYAMWCETHGFLYATKTIPDAWIKEKRLPK
ncbi:endodeoxyribonuclease I [Caudoviricetes sp.]|nr:endodeoxyribonuclease I [Caudoviricetes sp.]